MAQSVSEMLRNRAWDVKESPNDLGYEVIPGWGDIPEDWKLGPVAGVAADSQNRIYLYHRGHEAPPLICFDSEGKVLFSWDHLEFGRPHMVTIDDDDNVWLSDDGSHIIYKLSPEGKVLFTLGIKDEPGEDGTHFNKATDIAFNKQGEMYVSDGYGNKRIAKFDAEGNFLLDWGKPGGVRGGAPGEFALPHALNVDDEGLVYVADRENWRIQIFDPDGNFLEMWTHIGRPSDLIYADGFFYTCDHPNGRVTKVDMSGEVIGFFGVPGNGVGQLSSSHDIAYCPNGDIIVGQLDGRFQKFALK